MNDPFKGHGSGLQSPPTLAQAIAPDDGADLAVATRALNVAEAGLVRVTTVGGTEAVLAVAAGIPFPIRAVRVWATGTTATGIVGLT